MTEVKKRNELSIFEELRLKPDDFQSEVPKIEDLEEIDDVYYCKSVKAEKRKNILSDQHIPFRCPDEPGRPANIYIGSDFDEEPC